MKIFGIALLLLIIGVLIIYKLHGSKETGNYKLNVQGQFWTWFLENEQYFLDKKYSETEKFYQKYNEGNDILMKSDNNLAFELIGKNDEGKGTIVLTANGVLDSFPEVEKLFSDAPELNNWEITKYRPPSYPSFNIDFNGATYQIDDFYFNMYQFGTKENEIITGMYIYYKNLNDENFDDIQTVSMIFVDHLLGEYNFTTMIRGPIEFYAEPKEGVNVYSFSKMVEHSKNIISYAAGEGLANKYGEKAEEFRMLGKFKEAVEMYNKGIALNPSYEALYINRAVTLSDMGDIDNGLKAFDEASEKFPNSKGIYLNKGFAFGSIERHEEAIIEYKKALALDEEYAKAYMNMGDSLSALNLVDDALKSYDNAIKNDPKFIGSYVNKSVLLVSIGELVMANDVIDKALGLDPDFEYSLYQKGVVLFKLGEFKEAIDVYNHLLKNQPDHAGALEAKNAIENVLENNK